MINAWVLMCDTCGSAELEVNYVERGDGPEGPCNAYNVYCPKCENIGRLYGYTVGPIRLRAEKVREVVTGRVRP